MRLLAVAAVVCGLAGLPNVYAAENTHTHARPAPQKKKTAKSGDKPFGREGDPRRVKRVIKVEMSDAMRYFPEQIRVKRGDTVRFEVQNSGQMPHEMVLGTMDELKKHAAMMRKEMQQGNHEMEHDSPYMAYAAAGKSASIVWQFTRAGEFYYACLIPGHFEAGMIGTVVVR